MSVSSLKDAFDEVWLVDFEYAAVDGERPTVHCMVAIEFFSGTVLRLWADELQARRKAPFSVGPRSLFVAYYASAELGCFLALGWPLPVRILDLCIEFKCLTCGTDVPCGRGLLGALTYYGLDAIDVAEKDSMRGLALRGGPFSPDEKVALLDYCESDVRALAALLPLMWPSIDLPRALLRGRYMSAVARMEANGVPIDAEALALLRENWSRIKNRLVASVNADFDVYVPAGQRTIDPATSFGALALATADECGIDAHQLVEVVDHLYTEERKARSEVLEAIQAAAKTTGLTPFKIARWENRGGDASTYPGFDVRARELARELPALGLGSGFVGGEVYDDTDYASRLWDLLCYGPPKSRSRQELLRSASEILAEASAAFDAGCSSSLRTWTFSAAKFAEFLVREGIPWPRLESGALALDDSTFRDMAKAYPRLATLRELRHALSELRLESLAVGRDGRNRCMLSAFASRTSRNQPSNAKFIFGPSVWLRGLIRPAPGWAIAYLDYEQQEFGIAAALSGDEAMQTAYASGDPYLTFAKQAGAVPADATKETHNSERDRFKACVLAVQYGMKEQSLALRIGQSEAHARELLRLHRETYPKFWDWSQAAVDHAMLHGWLQTVFGWRIHVGHDANPRSLANFPMQANGAEMLRLACCLATERGVRVCAPVHDALLIEAPIDDIDDVVVTAQQAMREASEIVLDGFALRTDAKIVRHPERYMDKRGEQMWSKVWALVDELEAVRNVVDDPFEDDAEPVAQRHTLEVF
jgi:hypothetical protein